MKSTGEAIYFIKDLKELDFLKELWALAHAYGLLINCACQQST